MRRGMPSRPGTCMRVEGQVKPDHEEPEVPAAEPLATAFGRSPWETSSRSPRRSPSGCRRRSRSGSGRPRSRNPSSCQSNGAEASMIPVRPAIRNWKRNPRQKSIGAANRILPPHIVPSQLKILIPVGMPTAIVVMAKNVLACERHPDREHVVGPDAERQEADADRRGDHGRIAEDRLAREDRDDLGDERERRDHEHVDLGVAEDPEEVLPEHRRAARLRVEEVARPGSGRATA